jgi:hypothetical protein
MLRETREIADFERRSSGEVTAISDASTSGPAVEMAIGQANLMVFVSDEDSGSGSVRDASRADLLAAVMRLIPKGDPIRVVNIGDGNLRHVFARFRDRAGPDRCLFLDLHTSADPAVEQLGGALLETEWMDDALDGIYVVLSGWRSQHARATMTAAMLLAEA